MIRKWLKFNVCFFEILRNSKVPKNLERKWVLENLCKYQQNESCSPFAGTTTGNAFLSPFITASSSSINRPIKFLLPGPREKGDGEEISDSEENTVAVAEAPIQTKLFKIRGPQEAAFLVEVCAKDSKEVKFQVDQLRGKIFYYDKSAIKSFKLKCLLMAEPLVRAKDQNRLAKIHAISTGSDEVYELVGTGQFLFVNSVERTLRVKTILEKFQYKVFTPLYKFLPHQKASLESPLLDVCHEFARAVENLPKVLSVTHNL